MDNDPPPGDQGEAGRVARFLTDNPDWLATRLDIYSLLAPPRRVHGEIMADHMAAMIDAARQQAADMTAHAQSVLKAGRAAVGLAERVRAAVLALIRAPDVGEWVTSDLPGLLGIDSALLCIEGGPGRQRGMTSRLMARRVAAGTVARLLGRHDVLVRTTPSDPIELHGEAAGLAMQDALLRVQVEGQPPMLLALASRDMAVLEEGLPASMTGGSAGGGGRAALAFLGEALAARIETLAAANRAPSPAW
ncbi:hypothetical protein [Lichenicola sp.]|uniref:hypothetical protein n=1 Tax=Lichenicola sp. TaxID=2804529 RepID=UPI003B00BC63